MKKFKKVALLVATAAMVFGATSSVLAASSNSDTIYLSNGYANCELSVWTNGTYAETVAFSDYANVPITTYVEVTLVYTYGNHERESEAGYDSDRQNVVDSSSEAIVHLNMLTDVNTGVYANSWHSVDISDDGDYCDLYASYGNVID